MNPSLKNVFRNVYYSSHIQEVVLSTDLGVILRKIRRILSFAYLKCTVVDRAFGLPKSRFRCLHKTGGCLFMRLDEYCQAVAA
ncbi:hypothetical protein DPMN_132268 [Dreissena polymorpha]|uniref:Uncharacterized protein n=1 Tax=Dreissena polymorpha TaxID=45954 RepID=A0A9D4FVT3_DREPO|nr:hypothetical protein DPMN_132268 [Dreissena polymorpha]